MSCRVYEYDDFAKPTSLVVIADAFRASGLGFCADLTRAEKMQNPKADNALGFFYWQFLVRKTGFGMVTLGKRIGWRSSSPTRASLVLRGPTKGRHPAF
jgi:hypothetical protein